MKIDKVNIEMEKRIKRVMICKQTRLTHESSNASFRGTSSSSNPVSSGSLPGSGDAGGDSEGMAESGGGYEKWERRTGRVTHEPIHDGFLKDRDNVNSEQRIMNQPTKHS